MFNINSPFLKAILSASAGLLDQAGSSSIIGHLLMCGLAKSTLGRLRFSGITGKISNACSITSTVALTADSMPSSSNEVSDDAIAGIPYNPASLAAPIVPL